MYICIEQNLSIDKLPMICPIRRIVSLYKLTGSIVMGPPGSSLCQTAMFFPASFTSKAAVNAHWSQFHMMLEKPHNCLTLESGPSAPTYMYMYNQQRWKYHCIAEGFSDQSCILLQQLKNLQLKINTAVTHV